MAQIYKRKGGEILVNSETSGTQNSPSIAALAGGGYLITWVDASGLGGDSSIAGLKAQRFDADGNKIGGEFLVNTATANTQTTPAVTTLASGRFVISWTDGSFQGGDSSSFSIKAQLFEADGTKLGSEFLVNTATLNAQQFPTIADLPNGGFVISWVDASGQGGDSSNNGIKAQLFDAAGAKVGGEILVNTETQGSQNAPRISALASGGFAVAWTGAPSTSGSEVHGSLRVQMFDAQGAKVGSEFVASSSTAGSFNAPSIIELPSGFLVTWGQQDSAPFVGVTVTFDVRAQLFNAAGAKVGAEFIVNTTTAGSQFSPSAAALPGGGFIIAWNGTTEGIEGTNVLAQVFDASGVKVGVEFVVSNVVEGNQTGPKMDVLPSGDIVVTWTDVSGIGGDSSGGAVKSQILTLSNEAPTDISLSVGVIIETAREDVPLATFKTEGGLNSAYVYEILSDSSGGAFGIEGNRLVVRDNSLLDFETAPTVQLLIRTTDDNGHSYEETLTLNVGDTPEAGYSPATGEFLVNTTTDQNQSEATIVALASGGFVAIWQNWSFDGTLSATRAQIFDADGNPSGGEFSVLTGSVSAAPLPGGGFIVASAAPDGDMNGVVVATYDAAGVQIGNVIPVNTTTAGHQISMSVATFDDGGFVVTWTDFTPGSMDTNVRAQIFDSDGVKLGTEFLVNSVLAGRQESSEVTILPSGNFIISWAESGQNKAQLFGPSGVRIGVELLLWPQGAIEHHIVALASGGFVVTWADNLSGGGYVNLGNFSAQIFDATGARIGDTLLISAPLARVLSMDIAALPWGGFVATWADYDAPPSNDSGIRAQVFDGTGAAIGDQLFVNEITANDQWYPRVTVLESGDFIISWSDQSGVGGDPSGMGVKARIYSSPELDLYLGTPGDDVLTGSPGADRLRGLAGSDAYFVDNVGDVVIELADEGYDIIYAGVSYALAADSFVEVLATIDNTATTPLNLTGNALANYVTGNAGANRLDGGAGPDQLWGRGGDDSYYADAGDDVVEYEGDGYDILYARSSYGLGVGQSIEVLATIDNTATTAINLIGNALSNYIVGNAGANTLNGGGGDDQLWGREGDDSYIADMNDIVLEYAGQGSDILYATSSYILADGLSIETLATVDNTATTAIDLYGNELDNYVTGNAGANTLDGGTGSDTLWGRGGDDSYFADGNDVVLEDAGQGNDIIYARGSFVLGAGVSVEILATVDNTASTAINLTGNELDNYVTGNAGANVLNGGLGADQLFGRGGADTFAFTTALGGGNVDQILDFMSGGLDRIALDDAVFTGLTPGALPTGAFAVGSSAQEADDRILYNPQTGQLFFDADGSGSGAAAILFATITPGTGLSPGDFTVI